MALARWFESQLLSTAEAFVWTVEQITPERKIAAPPAGLGQWSAARHAFHLVYYEQKIALPSMRQWLDGPRPSRQGLNEQAAWGNSQDLKTADIQKSTPWNTYRRAGLPATPICNPGISAIDAAAHPAKTKYLYYVLTSKDGSQTFTTNYADFLKAVKKYRTLFGY